MPRVFALLFASQVLAQGAQLLTGLLIVRNLSIEHYAVYTIFALAVSLMALLSDPGMSQIFVSIGSKFSDDRARVMRLSGRVLKFSAQLAAVGAIPVFLYMLRLLEPFHLSLTEAAFFSLLIAAQTLLAQLERNAIARRNIFGDISGYGRTVFYSSNARLLYIAVFSFSTAMPWEYAVCSMPMGSLVTILVLRMKEHQSPLAGGSAAPAESNPDMKRAIGLLFPLLPGTAYSVLQGQLPLMLAAGFASAIAIGEYGALSRVGQIVGIAGVLNSNLLTKYMVQRMDNRRTFVHRILAVCGIYLCYICVVVTATLAFPDGWFVLIGNSYDHLAPLLLPAILTAGATLLSGVFYFATISLERTRMQALHFLGGAVAVAAFHAIRGLPITTSADLIWFGLFLTVAYATTQFVILALSISHHYTRQP